MSIYFYYIFLGMSPAIFWLWYFYKKDKWEPEPRGEVIKIFTLGIIAIIPAAAIEYIVQRFFFNIEKYDPSFQPLGIIFVMCFLIVAPVEEFIKYSVVKRFIYYKKEFDEKMDGVVYMVASAMGFAALENVMYIIGVGMQCPSQATITGILRGVLATPAHAIFSGFLGIYLGEAKFAEGKIKEIGFILKGFMIAILLHGAYNFLIFASIKEDNTSGLLSLAVIPLLVVSFFILMRKIRHIVAQSPYSKQNESQEVNP